LEFARNACARRDIKKLKKRLPQSQKRRENSKLMWRVSDRRKRILRGVQLHNSIRVVQETDAACLSPATAKKTINPTNRLSAFGLMRACSQ
jgi:hypothetical protein